MKLAILMLCLLTGMGVQGSSIYLTSSPSTVKPPLTENFTLTCSLHDTVPTGGGSGSIIGRKRRQVTHTNSQRDQSRSTDAETTPRATERRSFVSSGQGQIKRKAGVTNTSTNADFVTSLVISKQGVDVAAVSVHLPAKSLIVSPGFQVTGSLVEKSGQRAFLQMTFDHPTNDVAGQYRCDVDAVDLSGHSYDFTQTLEVVPEEVTMEDLVNYVSELAKEKETLVKQGQEMNHTIATLVTQMNKIENRVFFSVGVTKDAYPLTLTAGQTVVYNEVYTNVGGAYKPGTGLFICPIHGFYAFSISAGTMRDKNVHLSLLHNNIKMIDAFSMDGRGHQSLSNEVILKLGVNDTVKVVSHESYTSYIFSTSDWKTTTFSGYLIEAP